MATSSNVDSATASDSTTPSDSATSPDPSAETVAQSDSTAGSPANADDDSSSMLDRLETAANVVWAAFLALVVVFALIPAVALWFGAVPFDPPPARPYFAFVAALLVATAALIAGAIYDA